MDECLGLNQVHNMLCVDVHHSVEIDLDSVQAFSFELGGKTVAIYVCKLSALHANRQLCSICKHLPILWIKFLNHF